MRKLIYSINTTLDGCCDHTRQTGSDDILDYFAALLRDAGTLLYGRITYQLMVPFWPDVAKNRSGQTAAANGFAEAFDAVPSKVVFSRTLDSLEGARVVRGDLREEILKLKQEPGKDISAGGIDLASQLMELDLIDEYRFVVRPALVGDGRRLLEGISLPKTLQLKFVDATVLQSGSVALKYVKN
ncbi:MAG TPA: dihydrofolate reductase family protein [Dinghuibacter sp.]|jgi:dihydrofolate reductase|uniref:dihydrofolate reductase family protein n=1 Tax=Dinghuibacter sp. TaxID=2024697 RepID=UPI002B575A86|nr:dihydrofolate reductase family protein [Dinghuibacter sp.]HTJ13433.1 dihydrofolate reductase family protein [Dinghuibacter sp.]